MVVQITVKDECIVTMSRKEFVTFYYALGMLPIMRPDGEDAVIAKEMKKYIDTTIRGVENE